MLVRAKEIDYDYTNHRVSAVGNVQIYYGGSQIEADRVIYDETTKRLHAEGNVWLTEADGKVTHGEIIDLADNYRDGFVDSLRLETPERTRMAAVRAERTAGNFTVFHNGVYTACEPCKDDPRKPPEWQVSAVRIIHDQKEKMMYFEDARLEFFGLPIAWMPYFSAPDPTVKRKTGLLMPSLSSSTLYGTAVEIPYYWALAPNYDVTFAPMITTRQGPLLQGEFRHRLMNGAYSIRASGIKQWDKDYFNGPGAPGYRDYRGSVESSGEFAINSKWVWGWDAIALSDKTYLQDYKPHLSAYTSTDPFSNVGSEGISQLYLIGKGNRSYFDARSIYYFGFSTADVQSQIPIIHPVIDYTYTFDHPIMGGELSYNLNFVSLSRQQANFDAITTTAVGNTNTFCLQNADPALARTNCVLRGFPGQYDRFSAQTTWRRTITDSYGQMFTPFVSVRADAATFNVYNDPGVGNFLNTGDNDLVRAMPTVGLEYRYPFISVESWGTQTVEPIAQLIARPNETQIGKWPNEDAQSLIFDDSNLFKVDKFSGWDRVEGGGRANYGVKYTAQFNQGGFVKAVFGQSYSLFGQNSFAQSQRHQYRSRQRPRYPAVRLCRGGLLPAQQHLHVQFALSPRPADLRCPAHRTRGQRQFRSLARERALRRLRGAARNWLPGPARRRPRVRKGQTDGQLGAVRRGPIRPQSRKGVHDRNRPRLCRRLPLFRTQLHYKLRLRQRRSSSQPHRHVAGRPAHARWNHGGGRTLEQPALTSIRAGRPHQQRTSKIANWL